MQYYYNKTLTISFDDALLKVTDELEKQGFGVLTEIDVSQTLKKKLDIDFGRYRILGACNPPFAYKALMAEAHIGVLLPCNVIVQEKENGEIDVAAIEPLVSMQAVQNPALESIAAQIQSKLHAVIDAL